MNVPRHRWLLLLSALLLIACDATAMPTPTPRDFTAVLEALALRGATIHQAVAGDAGCQSVPLHGNAVRLEFTLQQDGEDYEVYLFRWRRAAHYDAAADAFEVCLAEYAADSGPEVGAIEMSPWRAFGPSWTDALREALAGSLRAAGGTG